MLLVRHCLAQSRFNNVFQTHLCLEKKGPIPLQLLRRYRFWLGSKRKAYSFSKEVTASMCTRKLEAFPTLETAGGYEIPQTHERGNCQLMVLSIPPGGYTVLYLKATTASAKGYKRPLQKDQVSTPSSEQEQMQVGVFLSPAKFCNDKYSLCRTQGA